MDCKSEMELEWMVGVVGGRRVRRNLPEEAVEKEKTPWLVLHQCISGNEQVINQHKWNEKLEALSFEKKTKKTHTLSQNRTFPADANTSWYLPHSISSKRQSVSVANILYDKQNNTWLLVDMYNFSSRVQLDISLICCAPIELNTQRQNSRSMRTHVLFPIYYFL